MRSPPSRYPDLPPPTNNMTYIEPIKTNWEQILEDLRLAKWTTYKVAHALGKKWETVDAWKNGSSEPRHSEGEALLKLHKELLHLVEP